MKRVAIVALTLFGLFSIAIHGQIAQPKGQDVAEGVLSRLVDFTETFDAPSTEAGVRALSAARVPGGIVQITSCEAAPVLNHWRAHVSTLREALDSVVQAEPDYYWSMNGGVVNLTPKSEEPTLLQIRISKLKVNNARSIYLPLSQLMDLQEVRESIAQLGLSQAPHLLIGIGSLKPNEPGYAIDCQNVTLKEALNTIVRVHGRAVWKYVETRCNGKTEFSIDFVVE